MDLLLQTDRKTRREQKLRQVKIVCRAAARPCRETKTGRSHYSDRKENRGTWENGRTINFNISTRGIVAHSRQRLLPQQQPGRKGLYDKKGAFARTAKLSRRMDKSRRTIPPRSMGVMSIPAIAKRLNRSVEAVIVREKQTGTWPGSVRRRHIPMNQLIIAVCGSNAGGNYKLKAGLRTVASRFTHKAVKVRTSFGVIRLTEFLEMGRTTFGEVHQAGAKAA